jgi:hypothetical protein
MIEGLDHSITHDTEYIVTLQLYKTESMRHLVSQTSQVHVELLPCTIPCIKSLQTMLCAAPNLCAR